MSEILRTTDYSMFKKHESNRPIDNQNLRKVQASMRARNMLEFRPILVDQNMYVIDGQHRLEAAKALACEVFYQIQKEGNSEDIILLNAAQKKWELIDYVNYHASKGIQPYIDLKTLVTDLKLPFSLIVRSVTSWGGKIAVSIKNGSFCFREGTSPITVKESFSKVNDVKEIIKKYSQKPSSFCNATRFTEALISMISNKSVDYEKFKSKITLRADHLKPCANFQAYYQLLKDIYNFNNRDPIE